MLYILICSLILNISLIIKLIKRPFKHIKVTEQMPGVWAAKVVIKDHKFKTKKSGQ